MHLRLWPRGLIGYVILVLTCAVVLEFVASSLVYEGVELRSNRSEHARRLAERLVVAKHVLRATPPPLRAGVARDLSTDVLAVTWEPGPTLGPAPLNKTESRLREDMRRWEPALIGKDLRLHLNGDMHAGRSQLDGSVGLPDGSAVRVSFHSETSPWAAVLAGLGSLATLSIGVVIAAILLLHSLGLPLRALAKAADSVGKGDPVYVREEGVGDLRRVARAFNAMQTRISHLITTRTHALAAVSHDLRTPLARLRLRVGLLQEAEPRAALERDLDEMSGMLDSLLTYLGGSDEIEAQKLSDLAATCMTLVDAATDAGGEATYTGPERLAVRLRPTAIKRALDNLVQNALIYGGRADVILEPRGDQVVVRICDAGPGIDDADMAVVKEAFQRLDHARARNTAGLGLGLSVVEQVANQEGGAFHLSNRPEGGLCAELWLPLNA